MGNYTSQVIDTHKKTLYEIINLSDPCTMWAESPQIAEAAVLLLGDGTYGLKDINGTEYDTVLFYLKTRAANSKVKKILGEDLSSFVDKNAHKIAECLDSVMLGGLDERKKYDRAIEKIGDPKKIKEYRFKRYNKNRTSLNRICESAWHLAEELRKPRK